MFAGQSLTALIRGQRAGARGRGAHASDALLKVLSLVEGFDGCRTSQVTSELECALGGAYDGVVPANGVSLVELRGLTPEYEYLVEVVSREHLAVEVFSGAGDEPFSGDSCEVFGSGVTAKRCVERPVGGALYLRVESALPGSTFEASVRAVEVSTLGSAQEPLELDAAALPLEGHVPGDDGAYPVLRFGPPTAGG